MNIPEEWLPYIWAKGTIIPNFDPDKFRLDAYKKCMQRSERGNRKSPYGWEVDHIKPLSEGGKTKLINLRPLHWKSNLERNHQ